MVSSFLAALALIPAIHVNLVAANDSSISWTVYHSWNPSQEFVRRGSLVWGPRSSGDGANDASDGKNVFQIINDDASTSITPSDIQEMLEYGWYHVKIQGDNSDGDDDNFVFQTVPACNLRRANFKDQFEITLPRSSLGEKQDPMTSFAYTPLVSPLAPKTCDDYDDADSGDEAGNTKKFSSRVSVQLDTPAMIMKNVLSTSKPPPGISFVKQARQKGGQKDAGGAADEDDGDVEPPTPPSPFGFMSKYWYIILPMLILQMITVPEEQGQQQQQQQQGGDRKSVV